MGDHALSRLVAKVKAGFDTKLQKLADKCFFFSGHRVGRLRAYGQEGVHGCCTDFIGRAGP